MLLGSGGAGDPLPQRPCPRSPAPWHPAPCHNVAGCAEQRWWEGRRAHFPSSRGLAGCAQGHLTDWRMPPCPPFYLGAAFKLRGSPCWCSPELRCSFIVAMPEPCTPLTWSLIPCLDFPPWPSSPPWTWQAIGTLGWTCSAGLAWVLWDQVLIDETMASSDLVITPGISPPHTEQPALIPPHSLLQVTLGEARRSCATSACCFISSDPWLQGHSRCR